MLADLVPKAAIPELAARIDSPAMLRVLRRLHEVGFIQNSQKLDAEVIHLLQQLTNLGLVDAGYDGVKEGKPFLWASNGNGERVLKYLETSPRDTVSPECKLRIHPRAHTALMSLPADDRHAVLAATEALLGSDPATWPREKVQHLGPDKPAYLVRVSPELRAFIQILDSGGIELFDIVPEDTLSLFLERSRTGSKVG